MDTLKLIWVDAKAVYEYTGWAGLLLVALAVRQFVIKDWLLGLAALVVCGVIVIEHLVKK